MRWWYFVPIVVVVGGGYAVLRFRKAAQFLRDVAGDQ